MQIIAMSAYARGGKDTAAAVLVKEFGFTQVAFADKLREMLYQLNPVVNPAKKNYFTSPKHVMEVQDVIEVYGWDGYKETPYGSEIRRLLQRLGTEAGRKTLWDTIWIDAAFAGVPEDGKIVVSDARFINEFDAVHDRGGVVWRIERPGLTILDHPSETEAPTYQHFDRVIENDKDLDYFQQRIREEYSMFRETH